MLDPVPHFSTFGKNYTRRFKDTDFFKNSGKLHEIPFGGYRTILCRFPPCKSLRKQQKDEKTDCIGTSIMV